MRTFLSIVILTFSFFNSFSQEVSVTRLSVENSQYYKTFEVVLDVKTNMEGFTGKLDEKSSVFTEIADNKGYSLLQAHVKEMEKKEYLEPVHIVYNGMSGANDGFSAQIQVQACPSAGATSVKLNGKVFMIMEGGKESRTKLKGVPMNGDEVDTKMGIIRIQEGGSMSTDDEEYIIYRVISNYPITSVMVKGDHTQTVKDKFNAGVEGNEFIFKSAPEKVDIELSYKDIETREILISKEVTLGF